jgi:hypothetical protein
VEKSLKQNLGQKISNIGETTTISTKEIAPLRSIDGNPTFDLEQCIDSLQIVEKCITVDLFNWLNFFTAKISGSQKSKCIFWQLRSEVKKMPTFGLCYDMCNAIENQRIIQSTLAIFSLTH